MYVPSPKTEQLIPYEPISGTYPIRLDANESFLCPPESLCQRMADAALQTALNRYPDPLSGEVCAAFARLYGISPELVTAGNGSDELISVIFSSLLAKGETVLTFAPDFSMYRFYSGITENPCIVMNKRDDLTVDVDEALRTMAEQNVRMVIFSNPCNPTSLGLTRDEVRRLIRGTDALVILDEAYMDFWDQSLLDEVADYDNLIILRTCSKMLGMAALRLGFAVANPRLTAFLRAAKSPYNVNAVSQAMATELLKDTDYCTGCAKAILHSRDSLLAGLKELQPLGLTHVYDSCTNFAYVELPCADVLFEQLKQEGIVVRCMNDRHLRITTGTQEQNTALLDAMKRHLAARKE